MLDAGAGRRWLLPMTTGRTRPFGKYRILVDALRRFIRNGPIALTAKAQDRQILPVTGFFWILPIFRPIPVSDIVRVVSNLEWEARRELWHVLASVFQLRKRSYDSHGQRLCHHASFGLRHGGHWRWMRHRQ
ncbi:MAG: hypothetical protein EA424_19195 [Planctomycetaceae bacterium]|nr:MAG: hypothetical protein EA424_19195 [Planctomycetaceae bacterium]